MGGDGVLREEEPNKDPDKNNPLWKDDYSLYTDHMVSVLGDVIDEERRKALVAESLKDHY